MVVHNLNISRVTPLKAEAQSPLLIDADAPKARSITAQFFQPVSGRRAQELYCFSRVK
jgi:hypothetical protein